MNLLMMVPFNIQALRNKKKREEFQYLAGNNLTDRDSILPKVFFVFFVFLSQGQ
jgi:hypothetical protein